MRSLNEFKEQISGIFEKSKEHDNFKNLTFIRWGTLNPVKQKGYSTDDENVTMHSPPARKGIYAFPYPYIELFLLGSDTFIKDREEWVKRPDGSLIAHDDSDVDEWDSRTKGKTIFRKQPDRGKNVGYFNRDIKLYKDYESGKIDQETYQKLKDQLDDEKIEKTWFLAKPKKPKKFTHVGEIWHHLKRFAKPNEILDEHGSWIKTDMETYKRLLSKEVGAMKKYREREGFGVNKDHLEVFIERIKEKPKKMKEKWERPLALGYSNEAEGPEEAEDILNNDEEEVPGETEFPTLKRLKMLKDKMSQHDLSFTVPYDEFRKRPSGEK